MNNRERFKNIMSFNEVDRIPVIEFASYWDETIARWLTEGLDPNRLDEISLRRDFGLDDYRQFWIEPYSDDCRKPETHGSPIISNLSEYKQIRKDLFPPASFDTDELGKAAESQHRGETVIWTTLEGFFWFPRYLLGIEKHLFAFYDQAELLHSINDELADYHCSILEKINRICRPDFMSFAEDLSYNQGPMIGGELFDQFLLPYYQRVIPELKKAGTLSFVDTDGRVEDIIPWYEQAGFDGCLPVECNADNDPERIRKNFPDWLMIGGVEKRSLYSDETEMKSEVERRYRLARLGGYIPSVDHQTPPQVSLSEYRQYLTEIKKQSLLRSMLT